MSGAVLGGASARGGGGRRPASRSRRRLEERVEGWVKEGKVRREGWRIGEAKEGVEEGRVRREGGGGEA